MLILIHFLFIENLKHRLEQTSFFHFSKTVLKHHCQSYQNFSSVHTGKLLKYTHQIFRPNACRHFPCNHTSNVKHTTTFLPRKDTPSHFNSLLRTRMLTNCKTWSGSHDQLSVYTITSIIKSNKNCDTVKYCFFNAELLCFL